MLPLSMAFMCDWFYLLLIAYHRDASSLQVVLADEAVSLGPINGPNGNPYQNIDLLIKTAKQFKADAIHPGYGYLSENAEFALKVHEAGMLFLGPSSSSMAVLGDKRSAKLYLLKHAPEIPLIPGYNGNEQSLDRLLQEADRIGFPILIKASAGGGGKGMRIVHERKQLAEELTRAQSEAKRSFGSSDCILEKYIQRSKHIEIQILGDSTGRVVSLLDRECSIQRRHQKVIEEAPSPWLSAEMRTKMSETAIAIGTLLKYESAGTVEFIIDVDTAKFYFLEVNTRIQVEHPITEETTGVDIVALQIYVAAGGLLDDLDYFQNGIAPQVGHAIECRLCAEDPSRDFLPDLGTILRWTPATEVLPASETTNVRFETGIETGSQISVYFDSLIAKIVVWAPTREIAIEKITKMMANTVCIGIRTNQSFLQACLVHSMFRSPGYTTNFIPDLMGELVKNPYVENFAELQQQLSFLPSLLRRTAQRVTASRRPFASIPYGFRNQKADAANVQADVVQIPNQSGKALLIEWPFQKMELHGAHYVNIVHVVEAKARLESSGTDNIKPSVQLAQNYNRLSTQLRKTGSSPTSDLLRVALRPRKTSQLQMTQTAIWDLCDLSIEVGCQRYDVYTVSEPQSDDSGKPQRSYVHVPALGTYVEYHLFSLLSYGESLRPSKSDVTGTSERDVKAPMPCKVLNVLKKNGDTVDIGDIGMVVESMKMEMNLLVTAKGIFKGLFKKGEAVEEGTVVFTVT
jgi:acetyl/propionyl-CoA carboxylase alpha subunit